MANQSSMQPKIALVYDRVNTPYGGAEQVLLAFHQAFPDAPLYTSVYDNEVATWAKVFDVRTSFLQKFPSAIKNHRLYVPLMPLAFESFDFSEFDVVISITSAEAKGIVTKPEQLHICYILTPTRYLHSHRQEYEQAHWPFKIPIVNYFSRKLFDYLTWWDKAAASRPDEVIAISELVKKRVEKYYRRKTSEVLYPPLPQPTKKHDTNAIHHDLPDSYLLVISRLVSYKRIDLVIRATQKLGLKLVIVGTGPAEKELRTIAFDSTVFLGAISEELKQALFLQANALVMPGIEDFGITAIDAVQANVPVIIHQHSGAAELLLNKEVAIHLTELTENNLIEAIKKLSTTEFEFSKTKKKLEKYAINKFVEHIQKVVSTHWQNHQKG